ncbi:M50 family metallopeptidase [Legionella taurinensis]|uniref:Peptidase n=1 Tax=Legionella taurinensis TaxID=70611 RepID=A0A3A5L8X3_9GAMM|nr:site-2 protease family protein [Legionella taurinensis]RJT48034.1 peptidase [Legionella taurinensis]RJT68248.1 peptidase [Legionella taurinensis]STY25567.1 membrane associated zinc metalloprotease [Legionella taurinensis]
MLTGLLAFLLTLLLVVGLHEAGHALAALLFNVKIQRIAIGFGKPLLLRRDKRGIEWVFALWPLGGYVRLLNSRIQPVQEDEYPFCFDKKPVWQRLVILLAGALANLLVAWVAFTLMLMVGYKQYDAVIDKVTPQSLAASAGFKAGDRLLTINGQAAQSLQDAGMRLIASLGHADIPVTVENQHQQRSLQLDLSRWRFPAVKGSLFSLLGFEMVSPAQSQRLVPGTSLLNAATQAVSRIIDLSGFFMVMLKQLFTGLIPFTLLLGPVGFLNASLHSFLQGFSVFLYFIASLSLTVGFVNLLPVPGLDGGSMVYAVLEKLRGKPVSIAMEVLLHRLALIFFMLVFVQLILNDLKRYAH